MATSEVNQTLTLFNDSVEPGNFTAGWGSDPNGLAFDPTNGEIFVTDFYPGRVSVLREYGQSGPEVVGTVPIAGAPGGIAYDPVDRSVYVSDNSGSVVYEINTTDLTVDATISVGSEPAGIVFDSTDRDLYVANSNSNSVTVLNGTTQYPVGVTIPIGAFGGSNPGAVAFDNWTNQIFVADTYSYGNRNPIVIINATTNTAYKNVTVGNSPGAFAYDPTTHVMYVANYWTNNVSAISDSNDSVVGTYYGFNRPAGLLYLPAQQTLEVADSWNSTLTAFNLTTFQIQSNTTAGTGPAAMANVVLNGAPYIAVADTGSASVSILGPTALSTDYYVLLDQYPIAIAYDPAQGELFQVNNVGVLVANVNETLTEVGLPVEFEASATGGTLPLHYTWLFGDGQVASTNLSSHTFASAGSYEAEVWANDSAGDDVENSVSVQVDPALEVSAHVNMSATNLYEPVLFTADPTGGAPPYTYFWSFGNHGTSSESSPVYSFTLLGNQTVTLIVNDSLGVSRTTSLSIDVIPTHSPPQHPGNSTTPGGLPAWTYAAIIGGVILVLTAAALGLAAHRKRRANKSNSDPRHSTRRN